MHRLTAQRLLRFLATGSVAVFFYIALGLAATQAILGCLLDGYEAAR